jgi:hypothetical protein
MAVNFRIYSKRTAPPPPGTIQQAPDTTAGQNISPVTGKPSLPGPYTAQQTAFRESQQQDQPSAPQQQNAPAQQNAPPAEQQPAPQQQPAASQQQSAPQAPQTPQPQPQTAPQ